MHATPQTTSVALVHLDNISRATSHRIAKWCPKQHNRELVAVIRRQGHLSGIHGIQCQSSKEDVTPTPASGGDIAQNPPSPPCELTPCPGKPNPEFTYLRGLVTIYHHLHCSAEESGLQEGMLDLCTPVMLQVHEEINSLQKALVKLKEQHLRNAGRDATAAAQFQAKISATEHQLERLRARERELQQEQGARKSHKKLSVF
ncbi:Hypp4760 [Branchiostoma lanceolatum]|uniref:Hypp4760 protein n=1 Tax=Branchiostoma lanceolatum TaxID=7740 RepID=A0A8K0A9X3_BRALA|nr:Hypp4760 [Branchiostoma lanceolatum]